MSQRGRRPLWPKLVAVIAAIAVLAALGVALVRLALGALNWMGGAVDAAMHHDPEGFIRFITDEISLAIADEQDEEAACRLNALHSVKRIEESLEIRHQEEAGLRVCAALYHVDTGAVEFV